MLLSLQVISEGLEQLLDAYVVVYAINDHASFETAQALVRFLRVDYGTDRAILLVANKTDLVRKRKVTADGKWNFFFSVCPDFAFAVCSEYSTGSIGCNC